VISTYDNVKFERQHQPLGEVMQRLRQSHERKFDEVLSLEQLRLDPDLRLMHNGSQLTQRGFAALAQLVEIPNVAVHWLKTYYGPELSRFVNDQIERLSSEAQACGADRRVFVRFRGEVKQLYCRALFSDRYSRLDNWPIMEILANSLTRQEQASAQAHRLWYDGDELITALFWPGCDRTVGGEAYKVGVHLQNSEVGTYRLQLSAYVVRKTCQNGALVNSSLGDFVSRRHIGRIDMAEISLGVKAAVACAMERADRAIQQLEYSRCIPVGDGERTILQASRELKLTKDQTRAWLRGHEQTLDEPGVGEVSVFSIVNGLTKGAQNPGFEPTCRAYLESLAGRILAPSLGSSESAMSNWWNDLQVRARSVSDEILATYL
jgi:hypothetical protein